MNELCLFLTHLLLFTSTWKTLWNLFWLVALQFSSKLVSKCQHYIKICYINKIMTEESQKNNFTEAAEIKSHSKETNSHFINTLTKI